jgi:aminoglycoside phosphotransferase (APT) family kinase protein
MPRRRAVLRVGTHVIKLYAKPEDFVAAVIGLRAASSMQGVRTAALAGHSPARLITAQPLLAGSNPSSPTEIAMEAGELLRELQAVDATKLVPDVGSAPDAAVVGVTHPSRQLAIAETSASYITAILPDLGGRLEALLRQIEATTPSIDRFVLTHGDFCARQLLVTPDGLAVVDWDAMSCAPAALDAATYAAHLVSGKPDDLEAATEALEMLLEGYGDRPAGLSWYFATSILRHSRYPFRYFVDAWPERTEAMVTAAEAALGR